MDRLGRDAAILLLTENVVGSGQFSWERWGRAAEWVGDLPLALDLLNRCLALGLITFEELVERAEALASARAATVQFQLDHWRDALRGQVPDGAVFGITEAFQISFERLDERSRRLAMLLAGSVANRVRGR
jgi:hypothetical protein